MSQVIRVAVAIALLGLLQAGRASAQSSRGSIQGRVTDTSNAVLQGATVMAVTGERPRRYQHHR